MKHYRQLFYALGGVLVLTFGILVFLVYQSDVEWRGRYKMLINDINSEVFFSGEGGLN